MKKAIIYALIAVVIGVAIVSISLASQDGDVEEGDVAEEIEPEPVGRNLSVNLDEKMGFSAP